MNQHVALNTPAAPPSRCGEGRLRRGWRTPSVVALTAAFLAACSTVQPGVTPPGRLPTHGAIAYTCANGTQLMVDYAAREARVAIIGGPSLVLPQTGEGSYSNGRYAISGTNAQAEWVVGRSAPVNCRGN